jgi:ubiquinone/menaquinone biosynthesis C-methylase UbiE
MFLVMGMRIMNSKKTYSNTMVQSESHKSASVGPVQKAANQYQTERGVKWYVSSISGTSTDRHERRCVEKMLDLANIPNGASVLDIPCGSGRLLPCLKKRGFRVTGADVSAGMVEETRLYAGPDGENVLEKTDKLLVANILETKFEDKQFDAVLSHRLFQYFDEPQTRRNALKELKRISSGPIIISFLCNWSVDMLPIYAKKLLGHKTRHCMPISCTTFAEDIRASGLVVERWIAMRPFHSKRWYVLLRRDTGSRPGFFSAYRSVLWAAFVRLFVIAAVILLIWNFLK